ncbi:MAG TPA: DUF1963 domain-containing protein [Allosphingosinicella sp.]|uniref:DUF1963 domain-containing protein n=1 Tax=Allosphingosinicella sp. TaxID=2823234 RepID=UPI002F2A6D12
MSFRTSLFGKILQGAGEKLLQAAAEELTRAAADAKARQSAETSDARSFGRRDLGSQRSGGGFRRAGSPPPVAEKVSVVLRRQVPVRFEEPPRSWIGGRPMMPDDVVWPIALNSEYPERGRCPLHFVAQIACADLPTELWGGLGPRTGWLLLFLSGEDWDVMSNKEALQVLHIAELGPEQEPPPNIGPVHNELYTGPDYKFVRSQDDVPGEWRHWPVDLITIPNRPIENDDARLTVIPDDFASTLYDGAPVSPDQRVSAPPQPPFSWRGALYVIDSIIRSLSITRSLPKLSLRSGDREKIEAAGWFETTIAALDGAAAKWLESPGWRIANEAVPDDVEAEAKRLERRAAIQKRLDRIAKVRALLVRVDRPDALWSFLESSIEDYLAWRSAAIERVWALRQEVLAHDLDSRLPEADWARLRDILTAGRQEYWFLGNHHDIESMSPIPTATSLLQLGESGLQAALVQIAADYHTRSPELRALIPPALIVSLEPQWRQLYNNRPHRMGGIHDAIQSDPRPGPRSDVLLFQIATDDAMHWVWGDTGAYYAFIGTDRLASADFSKIDASFENH